MSCRFDPTGQNIAACSADRGVCAYLLFLFPAIPDVVKSLPALWRTYPPNTNYGLLSNLSKAPILDLQWSLFSSILYTVSADHTLCLTDVTTGQRVRKIRAHREIINSVDRTMAGGAGIELVATGSDDGTVKIWEGGEEGGKQAVATFEIGCPVTSVCWSADGSNVYIGALDNEIHVRLLIFFPISLETDWECRYTTSARANRCIPCQGTLIHRHPLRYHQTGPSSSPHPYRRRRLSTTCGRSPLLLPGYIVSSKAPQLGSKTPSYEEHGARTTADSGSLSVALTGWCVSGRWTAGRFSTRY